LFFENKRLDKKRRLRLRINRKEDTLIPIREGWYWRQRGFR
jgi:hypothetical protein